MAAGRGGGEGIIRPPGRGKDVVENARDSASPPGFVGPEPDFTPGAAAVNVLQSLKYPNPEGASRRLQSTSRARQGAFFRENSTTTRL